MHVGHFAPQLEARGGISTYVRYVSEYQKSRGHRITYFSRDGGPSPDHEAVANAPELYERARRLGLDMLHLHKDVEEVPPENAVPVIRTMHGNQASCPNGGRYLRRSGVPCNRKYSVPVCMYGHFVDRCGSVKPEKLSAHFRRIRVEQRVLAHLHTVTVSEFLKGNMVRAGYDATRIHAIHSPSPEVDVAFTPPPEDPPRMVFVGRVVPNKGLEWLLKALPRCRTPIGLDVAGDGDQLAEMQSLVRKTGIEDRVTFHGWVDPSTLAPLLAAARAVVFPSVWHEPAGLVTLEAAAHGRAVIAGRVGGIPEYADPSFAITVPPNDIDALAQTMDSLGGDRDLATRMGQAGYVMARDHFSMDRFYDQLMNVYQTVFEEAGHDVAVGARA